MKNEEFEVLTIGIGEYPVVAQPAPSIVPDIQQDSTFLQIANLLSYIPL